jgi:mannose-6-phosphate isomerase-like protein (cupin superfamily)
VSGTGVAKVNKRLHALKPGSLLLIEHGDEHEVRNTGRDGDELPRGKP